MFPFYCLFFLKLLGLRSLYISLISQFLFPFLILVCIWWVKIDGLLIALEDERLLYWLYIGTLSFIWVFFTKIVKKHIDCAISFEMSHDSQTLYLYLMFNKEDYITIMSSISTTTSVWMLWSWETLLSNF